MKNIWRDPTSRERVLRVVIVAGIFLCAGPEIYAALELQILLEMLGVTLFTVAFVAGARLALMNFVESFRRHLLHVAPVALIALAFAESWLGTVAACIASLNALWTHLV